MESVPPAARERVKDDPRTNDTKAKEEKAIVRRHACPVSQVLRDFCPKGPPSLLSAVYPWAPTSLPVVSLLLRSKGAGRFHQFHYIQRNVCVVLTYAILVSSLA